MSKQILVSFQYYNNKRLNVGLFEPINIDFPHYPFNSNELIDKIIKYKKTRKYKTFDIIINYSDSMGNSVTKKSHYKRNKGLCPIINSINEINKIGSVLC
jgi:hypothetical protein